MKTVISFLYFLYCLYICPLFYQFFMLYAMGVLVFVQVIYVSAQLELSVAVEPSNYVYVVSNNKQV